MAEPIKVETVRSIENECRCPYCNETRDDQAAAMLCRIGDLIELKIQIKYGESIEDIREIEDFGGGLQRRQRERV